MADKEKNGNGMPTDAGTNKEWLRAVVNDKVEKATTWTSKETKEMGPKRPGSRLQEILQGFYWDLVDKLKETKFTEGGEIITAPAEDSFDKWYENMELETYAQKPKLMDVFNTIARMCQVPEAEGFEEEDFQSMLSHIMNRCMDEDEYLEVIARVINERYPGLASPFRSTPTVEEMQEYEDLLYRRRLDEVRFNIDTNIEEFSEELQKIEAAAKTDFEILARQLNELVIFGADAWELTLYCLMSPNAPRFIMNGLDYRSCIHEMLAGDISTAKSKVHKIAKLIAPKMLVVDDTTKPTFEGVAPTKSGGDIEDGVIDWANDGVMIVEEFTRTFSKMPLFRRVMDGEYIEIHKKGSSKGIHVNTAMLTACNPTDDFFLEEMNFRKQLPFKEGVLSRYWIVLVVKTEAEQLLKEQIIEFYVIQELNINQTAKQLGYSRKGLRYWIDKFKIEVRSRKGRTWEEIYGPEGAERKRRRMSLRMKGENNPMYGKKRPDQLGELNPSKRPEVRNKISQLMRGRKITWRRKLSDAKRGRTLTEAHRKAISEGLRRSDRLRRGSDNPATRPEVRAKMRGPRPHTAGPNNPNWRNGASFEPYDIRFNAQFKARILERDANSCQFPKCNAIRDLMVHHIDYDKKNTMDENCITLCRKHNSIVNFDREKWTNYFQRQLISLFR